MRLDFWKADFWADSRKNEVKIEARGGAAGQYYYDSYTGEKNFGEVGPIKDLQPHYRILNMRSWQLYLESDIAQTILNKYTGWIIDKGLKAQSTPQADVLKYAGITINQELNKQIESRFNLWMRSTMGDARGMESINSIARQVYKTAKVGGDCLVVLRYSEEQGVTVEMIDGALVQNPDTLPAGVINGSIVDGVEVDKFGKVINYHVKAGKGFDRNFVTIPAWSKTTGMRTAFLIKGTEYRINDRRGLPVVATVMEAIAKLDRYKEAMVGSAEERAKVVYYVQHQLGAEGENPFLQGLVAAFDPNNASYDNGELPVSADGQQLSNDFYASTNRQLWNLPVGSEMKAINSQNELFFKEFYQTNADIICGAIGIPPNVAFSVYNDSFSASRAATKDWDHTIEVERDRFREQFYQPIYNFWLQVEIMNGRIQAPGYMTAWNNGDKIILEAYRVARFTGPLFPHIDPVKEVKAARERLGTLGAHLPLSTVEQETELVSGGDAQDNAEQYAEELEYARNLGLEAVAPAGPPVEEPDNEEEDDTADDNEEEDKD